MFCDVAPVCNHYLQILMEPSHLSKRPGNFPPKCETATDSCKYPTLVEFHQLLGLSWSHFDDWYIFITSNEFIITLSTIPMGGIGDLPWMSPQSFCSSKYFTVFRISSSFYTSKFFCLPYSWNTLSRKASPETPHTFFLLCSLRLGANNMLMNHLSGKRVQNTLKVKFPESSNSKTFDCCFQQRQTSFPVIEWP